ncbi:MAG: antitermination protein NusG [Elusimicrobia bacterium]|nr:MAG: antitermination protein NusG [Elusimicrobiota bacterium]
MYDAAHLIVRWFHVIAGITWIGLLYFFNWINSHLQKDLGDNAKNVNPHLMPRVLWWFRWGAMFTWIMGVILYVMNYLYTPGFGFGPNDLFRSSRNAWILMGMGFGTLMWFNVWFIIWPAQKKLLGGTAGDDGPALKARATMASKINTYSSGPMLFGMLGAAHYTEMNPPVFVGVIILGFTAIWSAYAHSGRVGLEFKK